MSEHPLGEDFAMFRSEEERQEAYRKLNELLVSILGRMDGEGGRESTPTEEISDSVHLRVDKLLDRFARSTRKRWSGIDEELWDQLLDACHGNETERLIQQGLARKLAKRLVRREWARWNPDLNFFVTERDRPYRGNAVQVVVVQREGGFKIHDEILPYLWDHPSFADDLSARERRDPESIFLHTLNRVEKIEKEHDLNDREHIPLMAEQGGPDGRAAACSSAAHEIEIALEAMGAIVDGPNDREHIPLMAEQGGPDGRAAACSSAAHESEIAPEAMGAVVDGPNDREHIPLMAEQGGPDGRAAACSSAAHESEIAPEAMGAVVDGLNDREHIPLMAEQGGPDGRAAACSSAAHESEIAPEAMGAVVDRFFKDEDKQPAGENLAWLVEAKSGFRLWRLLNASVKLGQALQHYTTFNDSNIEEAVQRMLTTIPGKAPTTEGKAVEKLLGEYIKDKSETPTPMKLLDWVGGERPLNDGEPLKVDHRLWGEELSEVSWEKFKNLVKGAKRRI